MKCHFYVIEKFCDFFTLRSSDYVLMDNFCSYFFTSQALDKFLKVISEKVTEQRKIFLLTD